MNLTARLAALSPRLRLSLAALSGLVGALGLAPFDLWIVGLVGFTALALLISSAENARRGAWLAWAGGAGYFALALHWIVEPFLVDIARHGWMAPFALLLMASGLALFWALAGWFCCKLTIEKDLRPLAWAVGLSLAEFLRANILTGFPWALPGHIWANSNGGLVASSVVGEHGLTLTTLIIAATLASLLQDTRRFIRIGLPAFAGLGIMTIFIASMFSAYTPAIPDRTVRLIQPNAPQHLKWRPDMIPVFFERALELTAAPPEGDAPELVIWPETSLPTLWHNSESARNWMAQAAGGAEILVGGQRFEGDTLRNTAFHLDSDGALIQLYDKHHLVPFGEYLPLTGLASRIGLRGLAESAFAGYTPGPGPQAMQIEGFGSVFAMICYETIFPSYIRQLEDRPNLMIQITNDAWFGNFSGPYQHLAMARLRAAEQGIPLIRVANTGVSAMIDAHGNITASLPLNEAGYLDVLVPNPTPQPTFYARYGDLPLLLLLGFFTAGLVLNRFVIRD